MSAVVLSFVFARTCSLFPTTIPVEIEIQVHHFLYGKVLLAIGGRIGISYNDRETDLLSTVLYGVGGGLIVDEVELSEITGQT